MNFSPYQHAAEMSQLLMPPKQKQPRPPATGATGLPATSPQNRDIATRNRNLGATQARVGPNAPKMVPVVGAPSVHLVERNDNSVVTEIVRNLQYAENLSDPDLKPFWDVGRKMERSAVDLSHGPLKQLILNKMGNPYGMGRRRGLGRIQGNRAGISNRAIVNEQSGELARSWYSDVKRSKGQVVLFLGNTATHSGYTAFGTSRMKAHGPYTAAVVKHLPELNEVARRLGYLAYQREMMMRQMGVSNGGVS